MGRYYNLRIDNDYPNQFLTVIKELYKSDDIDNLKIAIAMMERYSNEQRKQMES